MTLFLVSVCFALLNIIALIVIGRWRESELIRLPRMSYTSWLKRQGLNAESSLPGFKLIHVPNELAMRDPSLPKGSSPNRESDYAYVKTDAPAHLLKASPPVPPSFWRYAPLGLISTLGILSIVVLTYVVLFFDPNLSSLSLAGWILFPVSWMIFRESLNKVYRADVRNWVKARADFLEELDKEQALVFIDGRAYNSTEKVTHADWRMREKLEVDDGLAGLTTPGSLVTNPLQGTPLNVFEVVQEASESDSVETLIEAGVTLSEALEVHHTVESNRQKRDEGYEWLETAKSEQLVGAKLITLVLDRLTQNDTELNEALQNKVEGLRGRLDEPKEYELRKESEAAKSELQNKLERFVVLNEDSVDRVELN